MAKTATQDAAEHAAQQRKSPRPVNKKLQTLARIDRLFADHTEEEIQQMVMWLVANHVHGRFKMIVGSEPIPEWNGTPPKE